MKRSAIFAHETRGQHAERRSNPRDRLRNARASKLYSPMTFISSLLLTLPADSSFGRLDVALTAKTVVRHVCDSICGMPYMRLQSICAKRCMFPSLVVAVCNAVSGVLQQILICWGVEGIVVALFTRDVCALRQRRRHFPGYLTDYLTVYTQDVESNKRLIGNI